MHPTAEALRAFGLGTPTVEITEAARGAMGRVFRVETSTGVWAVKELFHHSAAEHVESQASFMESAANAGIGVPRIIRSETGEVVALVDGVPWRAYEWIDIIGKPALQEAGSTLARLHAIGWPTDDSVDPWYTRGTVGGSWEALVDRARDQPWAPLLRSQLPAIQALDQIVEEAALPPCRMCHRDFNESNLAVDRAGRIVVLDWDNCGPLPPEREVGSVLADSGREFWHVETLAGAKEFINGYREAGGVFASASLDVFATAIAAHHNFLAEMISATLAGDDWAEVQVGQMLAFPLRLAYLERILDAIR